MSHFFITQKVYFGLKTCRVQFDSENGVQLYHGFLFDLLPFDFKPISQDGVDKNISYRIIFYAHKLLTLEL